MPYLYDFDKPATGGRKSCVAGCEELTLADGTASLAGQTLREGNVIMIDGGTGRVFVGAVPLVSPQITENFETILHWADAQRRLKVRANADNPEAAKSVGGDSDPPTSGSSKPSFERR